MLKYTIALSILAVACGRPASDIEHPKPIIEPAAVQGPAIATVCKVVLISGKNKLTWSEVDKGKVASILHHYAINRMEVTCHDVQIRD
jgi:hypothetical protein